jgi:hypothetical protein
MAGLNEPNDESVDVDLPLPTAGASPNSKSRETVRSQLPVREHMGKSPLSSTPLSASVVASPDPPASGLKKETARVSSAPDPFPSAGETKNPEPRVEMPYVAPQNFFSCCCVCRKKTNAALVDSARAFGNDFDYSDLDLFFLSHGKLYCY